VGDEPVFRRIVAPRSEPRLASRRSVGEPRIRVIVAEPASRFRNSVVSCLSQDPSIDVAAVGSSEGIVRACASRPPNVALMAVDLPPHGGLSTVERVRSVAPGVQIVVWSASLDGAVALAALRAGARGVLEREISGAALVRCVKEVAAGQASLPRHLVEHVIDELQSAERRCRAKFDLAGLSARERQVLGLIGEGNPNRTIALQLGISEFTVKRHVHNILEKLGVPSRAAAARLYGSAYADGPRSTDVTRSRAFVL
jgi:two-component system response regulator DevR